MRYGPSVPLSGVICRDNVALETTESRKSRFRTLAEKPHSNVITRNMLASGGGAHSCGQSAAGVCQEEDGPAVRHREVRGPLAGQVAKGDAVWPARADRTPAKVAQRGETTPITTVDRAAGELSHRGPTFLPDGEHFLYVVLTKDGPGKEREYTWPRLTPALSGRECLMRQCLTGGTSRRLRSFNGRQVKAVSRRRSLLRSRRP